MNIKLITHDDLDGLGCYIALRCFYEKSEVDLSYCDYNEIHKAIDDAIKEHYKYDMIYLTDISISEQDELALNKISHKIKFFDHHKTSLHFNKYDWSTVLVDEKINSKTNITSNISFNNISLLGEVNSIKTKCIETKQTCAAEIFARYLYKLHNVNEKNNMIKNLDIFIESVRRYDTWDWYNKYKDVSSKKLNNLLDAYGAEKFSSEMIKRIKNNTFSNNIDLEDDLYYVNELPINFTNIDNVLLEIRENEIQSEIKIKNSQIISKKLLEYNIGVVFEERFVSEVGHALCELNPQYDLIVLLSGNTKSFRTIKDIDLSVIAKKFGGGGHYNSSGCSTDTETVSKMIDLALSFN